MAVALLDVNVLVALFDPDHVHHDAAHDWFEDHRGSGWATSPITESGFVRVLSNPQYAGTLVRPSDLAGRLTRFCRAARHTFWPADVSLLDTTLFDLSRAGGHRQLTDVYLLGLAVSRGGCLATFDRSIPLGAVKGATPAALQVISLAD
jgi:uncharacterized protein